MSNRTYTNNLTLDGRLKVVNGVSAKKVSAVKSLWEGHMEGNRRKSADLHEAITTSDASFNFAHFASLNFVPNYDEEARVWTELAGERTVPDFRPVTLYSLNKAWTDGDGESNVLAGGGGDLNAAPVIPEGTAYPYAYISGDVAEGSGVLKRGFKTDWTLESRINDGIGALEGLPTEMLDVALDTEESDVFGALLRDGKGTNSTLKGGVIPSGETVVANAPISRESLTRAIIELSERKINGRKLRVSGGYNLVVPTGQAIFVQFILNQIFSAVKDGSFVLNIEGYNPLAGISVVESDQLTGQEWFLLPKKGTTRRPVLEHLKLRGYETPQLMVDNHVGSYLGAASVSPFEGSFDADVITLKLRMFGGAVLWDEGLAVLYSNGTGA